MARAIIGSILLLSGVALFSGRRRLAARQTERIGRPFAPRATVALAGLLVFVGLLWIDQA